MNYRPLGTTGIQISAISFGAGPVPALLTRPGQEQQQRETIRQALDAGINWFDTAATYGEGRSEAALGAALHALGAAGRVHVATKVRLRPEDADDIGSAVRASFAGSLSRLGVKRVTLLQVHNSITAKRGDLATSITPRDVLGPGGMLEAFERLRQEGRVDHFGLTGLGDEASLSEVIQSGAFATIQLPYNVLTPTVRGDVVDDGRLLNLCRQHGVAALAIRVLAGGALALQPPSEHTKQTKFFPLDLYERDLRRAAELQARLPGGMSLPEFAVRFVLSRPGVASALVGFSSPEQLAEAVRFEAAGALAEPAYLPLLRGY